MTLQNQIKETMQKSGIAAKQIQVYGSQIVVTSYCAASANKWADFIGQFAKVRAVVETFDDETRVWRTFGRI